MCLPDPAGNPRRQSAVGHYSSSVSATTISDNVVVAVATNTLVPLHLHWEGNGGSASERQNGRHLFIFLSSAFHACVELGRNLRGQSATSAGKHGVRQTAILLRARHRSAGSLFDSPADVGMPRCGAGRRPPSPRVCRGMRPS